MRTLLVDKSESNAKLCFKSKCVCHAELGKLCYESNILHITSYFYKEVIYYSYILLYQKSKFVILLVTFKSNNIM